MSTKNTPTKLGLDPDVAAAISAAYRAALAPQAVVNNVRGKLLKQIATEATPTHRTVHANTDQWFSFLPKIDCKILNDVDGITSYLLRMKPGAVLPAHRHPIDEECIVIEGELRIGDTLRLTAGAFHLGRKDTPHDDITTDVGALIFLRGATPTAEMML
jgi:hypothetical protein